MIPLELHASQPIKKSGILMEKEIPPQALLAYKYFSKKQTFLHRFMPDLITFKILCKLTTIGFLV